MVRITYKEVDGLLVSKEVIGNGNLLVAKLNPSNLTFTIENAGGNHTFSSGKAVDLSYLKKAAKKALVELGVTFVNEVRTIKEKT